MEVEPGIIKEKADMRALQQLLEEILSRNGVIVERSLVSSLMDIVQNHRNGEGPPDVFQALVDVLPTNLKVLRELSMFASCG